MHLSPPVPDYKNIFISLPGLFLALSPELIILGASNNFLKITGYTAEELMGQPMMRVCERFAPDTLADHMQEWQRSLAYLLQYKKIHYMEMQCYQTQQPDGRLAPQYWQPANTPVLNKAG